MANHFNTSFKHKEHSKDTKFNVPNLLYRFFKLVRETHYIKFTVSFLILLALHVGNETTTSIIKEERRFYEN